MSATHGLAGGSKSASAAAGRRHELLPGATTRPGQFADCRCCRPCLLARCCSAAWNRKFNCNKRGCFDSCPNTKPYFAPAYTWIAAQPNLSTLEALLDLFATNPAYAPTVNALKGDFGGTIVAPTDAAFAEYTKQMVVPVTNPAVQPFLWDLVTYHVLGQRLYVSNLKPGTCYDTLYAGLDGGEAEVLCWGESASYEKVSKPKWAKKWGKSYSSAGKKTLAYYFVDEQQNTIPLACADKWVQGGGVIHTVTKVAQPSDLFPSIAVAATKAGLTTLAAAVTEAGLLNTLETTISIVFAPTNTVRTQLLAGAAVVVQQLADARRACMQPAAAALLAAMAPSAGRRIHSLCPAPALAMRARAGV